MNKLDFANITIDGLSSGLMQVQAGGTRTNREAEAADMRCTDQKTRRQAVQA